MSERLTGDFRKYMDKKYLGAWDLNETGDTVLTVDYVARDEVQNDRGKEKKLTIHFKEKDYKPMICNVTNAKIISEVHKSPKVENWSNKKIALYRATIAAFGQTTECIRVRDYAPKTDEFFCEECGELIGDVTIDGKKYRAKAIANNALTKFGKYLCYDCAQAAKAVAVMMNEEEADAGN